MGNAWVRIKNNGPDDLSNGIVKISAVAPQRIYRPDLTPGVGDGTERIMTLSIAKNQSVDVNLNWTVDSGMWIYVVVVVTVEPVDYIDPNTDNNTQGFNAPFDG